jgi:hypothetical protein
MSLDALGFDSHCDKAMQAMENMFPWAAAIFPTDDGYFASEKITVTEAEIKAEEEQRQIDYEDKMETQRDRRWVDTIVGFLLGILSLPHASPRRKFFLPSTPATCPEISCAFAFCPSAPRGAAQLQPC